MNDRQVKLVQLTWSQIAPESDRFTAVFYDHLFTTNPELRSMFDDELTEQRHKLVTMLTIVVHGLNNFEGLIPAIKELGRRHVSFGVTPQHYEPVASALLAALAKLLGSSYTVEVQEAWSYLYGRLAELMCSPE